MYLIVGLGNPDKKYENTFHNLGFMSVDKTAEILNVEFNKVKCKAQIAETKIGNEKILLAKPQTYMNLSGESIGELLSYFKIELKDLIVIYDMVLYSLPAQTTPKKVIVLNMAQEVPAEAEGFSKIVAGEKEFDYVEAEGAEGMIPVRSVLEALGFTVEWNGELRSVMINSGKFTFAIGEDYYTIGRMAPVSLGQAPVCVCVDGTGITHVPMSFFTEIVGLNAEVAEGTLTFSIN